jgi:hypothetical protein
MKTLTALFSLLSCLASAGEVLLKDDFSSPTQKGRRASRGEWRFQDNTASCTQDDELYKQHKNHGPIIFYDLPHTDATIRFSYKVDAAKSVVFTCNGAEGHVFRFVSSETRTTIRAFPKASADHKSVELAEGPALVQGQWVDVEVAIKGPSATVKIGKDFTKTVTHADLAMAKTNLSIGFAFGTLSVKGVEVSK